MIAREGLVFILSGAFLTIVTTLAAVKWDSFAVLVVSIVFSVLTLFTIFFFRDPERVTPKDELELVAPADGKVIGIETIADDPYIGGEAQKISIFLSVLDVHINRVPLDGRVEYVKYTPGKFFAAFEDKASEENEHTEIGIVSPDGRKVIVKQIAGIIARRIVCRLNEGSQVKAGERFGMIRFGSRTELIVPAESRIEVRVGDRVRGAETIMGYLTPAKVHSGEGD